LPAVCDLWEWVDVGTHGVRERHERRGVPDASPLATEGPQRLSACPHPRTAQPIDHTAAWPGREYVRTPQTLPLQSPRPCPRRRPRPRCPLAARSAQEAPGNGQSGVVRLGKVVRARSAAHGMYSGSGCATASRVRRRRRACLQNRAPLREVAVAQHHRTLAEHLLTSKRTHQAAPAQRAAGRAEPVGALAVGQLFRGGPSFPRLHRDWARPCHICTGTGLAPATSPRTGLAPPTASTAVPWRGETLSIPRQTIFRSSLPDTFWVFGTHTCSRIMPNSPGWLASTNDTTTSTPCKRTRDVQTRTTGETRAHSATQAPCCAVPAWRGRSRRR
jgi:hypothetical protein